MARPASSDPVDKFRFEARVLDFAQTFVPAFNLPNADAAQFVANAGFTEITIPKSTVTVTEYRENVHTPNLRKQPGLLKYEDLVLRKGVTTNQDFYKWLNSTNSVVLGISTTATAVASGFTELNVVPTQDTFYRRDMVVSVKDRTGKFIKHWFFYNCFVSGYKPGNDLDAKADEKLIEELTISFETLIESSKDSVDAALVDINIQIGKQFAKSAVTAFI